MDTHEVQDTHLRDPQGSRVEIHVDQTMADVELDPSLGDHGLVDMVDFWLLQMRTACLESHIASINQNLTDLTNLVKNMVINLAFMAPGTRGALQPPPVELQVQVTPLSGGDNAQHPSIGTSGVNPPITSPVCDNVGDFKFFQEFETFDVPRRRKGSKQGLDAYFHTKVDGFACP